MNGLHEETATADPAGSWSEHCRRSKRRPSIRLKHLKRRHVYNTLHSMAKTCYRPWGRTLVPELEGRAEALADTFNAQEVANMLWAYAKTGWKGSPGRG
jgi:hypothetical protein